ncbi:MAG: heme-binding protein [Arenicellales bacterium]|nr:heme-binding protein [Arenicellales bacterium]
MSTRAYVLLIALVLGSASIATMEDTMAYEELRYKLVEKTDAFELRDYEPHIVAEVRVQDRFDNVGDQAFKILFDYISGKNTSKQNISMTIPVTQQPDVKNGERIAMTTPVLQTPESESGMDYVFSFVMPSEYTMETIPAPIDPRIKIKSLPGRLMAVHRYSGGWSEGNYRKHEAILIDAIRERGLSIEGNPIYARYNSPFSLWFLRRNEVLVEVKQ